MKDICDMYADADLYGLGKGIFPKDKAPVSPSHPHCLCHYAPVYKSELEGKDQRGTVEENGHRWLKNQPLRTRQNILGVYGEEEWKQGFSSWMELARNLDNGMRGSRLAKLMEREESYGFTNDTSVDKKFIRSKKYHDKFEKLTKHKAVNEALYQVAKNALLQRDGTEFENIYMLHANTGEIIVKNDGFRDWTMKLRAGLTKMEEQRLRDAGIPFEIFHNHPHGSPPSAADIKALFNRKYAVASTVGGHDGSLYRIEKLKEIDFDIEEMETKIYNEIKENLYGYTKEKVKAETRNIIIELLVQKEYIKYRKR